MERIFAFEMKKLDIFMSVVRMDVSASTRSRRWSLVIASTILKGVGLNIKGSENVAGKGIRNTGEKESLLYGLSLSITAGLSMIWGGWVF